MRGVRKIGWGGVDGATDWPESPTHNYSIWYAGHRAMTKGLRCLRKHYTQITGLIISMMEMNILILTKA